MKFTEQGWGRHCLISLAGSNKDVLSQHLPRNLSGYLELPDIILVVATYDCALVHDDLQQEPWVQLLLAFPVDYEKGLSQGRHERRIHFEILVDSASISYETNAACFFQIDRRILLELERNESALLGEGTKNDLKIWLAERFRRDVFPDAFNSAITPIKARLKRYWKRNNTFLSGLYIKLHSYDELENERYRVMMVVSIEKEKERAWLLQTRERSKSLKNKSLLEVKAYLEAEVVDIFSEWIDFEEDSTNDMGKAVALIGEEGLTLDVLRNYRRLSPYSLSGADSDNPLPVEILPS